MEEITTNNNSDKLALVDYYLKLLLKKRWFIIVPFCLIMAGGIIHVFITPEIYSARNLIVVVPKQVPDQYVKALQTTDISERINTIKEQILSRSSLEAIMKRFNLYSGPDYENMYEEDKLERLRRNVSVNVNKSRHGVSSFQIVFRGNDPQKVRDVVNSLAESFINESVVIMQQEALNTNRFLQDELNAIRKQLEFIEKSIERYRREHMGELPQELPSNLKLIERFQLQLNDKQQSIRDAKNRISELDNLIAAVKMNAESQRSATAMEQSNRREDLLQQLALRNGKQEPTALEQMKKALVELRTRYTDRHPDVLRLESQIETMEAQQGEPIATLASGTEEMEDLGGETMQQPIFDETLFDLMNQRRSLAQEVNTDIQDIKDLEQKIEDYQKRVENTSRVELGLMALQRNYDNIQRNYENLLDRKLESDIAVNMEKKQKGTKFRVIDRAKLPQKPIAPDVKMIFVMCFAAGIGSGVVLIIGLDFVSNAVKQPEEVENTFEMPLLAIVPKIMTSKDRMLHRLNQAMSLVFIGVGGALTGIFGIMAIKGVSRTVGLLQGMIS